MRSHEFEAAKSRDRSRVVIGGRFRRRVRASFARHDLSTSLNDGTEYTNGHSIYQRRQFSIGLPLTAEDLPLLPSLIPTMSAPSIASYVVKRPWLKRWMMPLATWYSNAAGYRKLGLR